MRERIPDRRPLAVGVVRALDLVRRRRGTPQKGVWESLHGPLLRSRHVLVLVHVLVRVRVRERGGGPENAYAYEYVYEYVYGYIWAVRSTICAWRSRAKLIVGTTKGGTLNGVPWESPDVGSTWRSTPPGRTAR